MNKITKGCPYNLTHLGVGCRPDMIVSNLSVLQWPRQCFVSAASHARHAASRPRQARQDRVKIATPLICLCCDNVRRYKIKRPESVVNYIYIRDDSLNHKLHPYLRVLYHMHIAVLAVSDLNYKGRCTVLTIIMTPLPLSMISYAYCGACCPSCVECCSLKSIFKVA
jgi:hypothetical protein